MSKSILDYAEKMGLEIAYESLKLLTYPSNEQCIVIEWMDNRIKELQKK